ncbi:MAG TPA: amidase [Arenicellales bacterium]|nr:amidase [Arenicellales bacterium]
MSDAIDDPASLSAREAADAIRSGRLSSRELVDACLERIEARDTEIGAWDFLDPTLARRQADARDADGEVAGGPLHGLPVGVKDIIDTADMPTACNSPIYRDLLARSDAACVAALRAAGGVVLGKTATTEFAAYTPTRTRNPLNPGHSPGGSSSGSAAAVADGQVPLAIGTQTAGSVIRPASFCGIVGFKPSFGIIDRSGVKPFADCLDTVGVFARSVGDAALFAGAMAGWPEMTAVPGARPPERVRLLRAPHWERITEAADEAVTAAARVFEAAGVPVEEMDAPDGFDDLNDTQDLLQVYEGRRALAWEREHHGDLLSTGLREHFARAQAAGFDDYLAARRTQEAWQRRFDALLEPGDVILTASAPGEAPHGLESTGDPVFCRPWTLLHLPCITQPHGRGPAGLPLGVQLVAPRWNDLALLAAARWLGERLN